MDNHLVLTDDELSLIQTALQMTLMSIEKYKEQHGSVDFATQLAEKDMGALFDRLNKEYFK